jgi:hypothetical protein|tara:strand:+ start:292 stop:498 length:207 start_codon:yes stop_codon:yes gene_type:complete
MSRPKKCTLWDKANQLKWDDPERRRLLKASKAVAELNRQEAMKYIDRLKAEGYELTPEEEAAIIAERG